MDEKVMESISGENVVALVGALRSQGAAALADRVEALGAHPAAQALGQTAERVSQLLNAVARNQPAAVGEVLRQWMPELLAHRASAAISQLGDQARELLASRELAEAAPACRPALEARQRLERIAALKTQAAELRRFEQAAAELQSRWPGNWEASGADLLRRFGMR